MEVNDSQHGYTFLWKDHHNFSSAEIGNLIDTKAYIRNNIPNVSFPILLFSGHKNNFVRNELFG